MVIFTMVSGIIVTERGMVLISTPMGANMLVIDFRVKDMAMDSWI